MKILRSGLLTTLFLVFCGFASAQSYAWESQFSGTNQHLFGVFACADDTVYAVGYSGTILKTVDGGMSWNSLNSGVLENLYDVHFTSADTGYVIGDNGVALKTSNGGITWTQLTVNTTVYFRNVHFISSNTGFIAGGTSGVGMYGTILKTTDGGITWNQQNLGSGCFYGIDFISPTHGFVSSFIGEVYTTTDGGITWNGFSTGVSTSLSGVMATPNAAQLFAVGVNGNIRVSPDSGNTWTGAPSTTTCELVGIDFCSSLEAVVTGGIIAPSIALVLTTVDGGITWTSTYPPVPRLTKVDMLRSTLGYAVGISGTIIKYDKANGINEVFSANISLVATPNPFTSSTKVDCSLHMFQNDPSLFVYDLNGNEVRNATTFDGTFFIIEKNGLAQGLYFFSVYDGEIPVGNGKLILQ